MLIECQRHQQVEIVIENPEAARHDTYDLAWLRIELDRPPHDRAIAAEASLPVSVVKHHALSASGVLVGRVKPSAGSRRNGERLEHAIADERSFYLLRLRQPSHIRRSRFPDADRLKAAVVCGKREIH